MRVPYGPWAFHSPGRSDALLELVVERKPVVLSRERNVDGGLVHSLDQVGERVELVSARSVKGGSVDDG